MTLNNTPHPSFITFTLSGADLCTYTATYTTTTKQNKMTESRSLAFPCEEEFMAEEAVNTDFPSNGEFAKANEKAIPWREVECGTPFKVLETRGVSTKNGEASETGWHYYYSVGDKVE